MTNGKAHLLEACRNRRMKLVEKPINLLETRVNAEGQLDGMDVRLSVNCISGMPGESRGTITFRGSMTELLSVLGRVWPVPNETREVMSPGRQCWPAPRSERNQS